MTKEDAVQEILLDTFTELQRSEITIADTIAAHPKRRGELRAEYTRRILRLVRAGK